MPGHDAIEWAGWFASGPCVAILLWLAARDWLSSRFGRTRRIPRCPGVRRWVLLVPVWQPCGYDMRGVPADSNGRPCCPECGRVAASRRLLKRPIRWRLVLLCAPLLLGGYASRVLPRVSVEGWTGWVPTWMLVAALPWAEEHPEQFSQPLGRWVQSGTTIDGSLRKALEHRLTRNEVRGFERRLFFELAVGADWRHPPFEAGWDARYGGWLPHWLRGGSLTRGERQRVLDLSSVTFDTRQAWPAGCDVYVRPSVRRADFWSDSAVVIRVPTLGHESRTEIQGVHSMFGRFDSIWADGDPVWENDSGAVRLGPAPAPGTRIEFHAQVFARVWGHGEYRDELERAYSEPLPITTVHDLRDVLTLVPGEAMVARWYRAKSPILRGRDHPASWGMKRWALDLSPLDMELSVLDLDAATLALTAEIMADGVVVATAQAWWGPPNDASNGMFEWEMVKRMGSRSPWLGAMFMSPSAELVALPDLDVGRYPDAQWTVRLRGDPALALRDFEATHAWAGEVELPLRVEGIDWTWPPPAVRRFPVSGQPTQWP